MKNRNTSKLTVFMFLLAVAALLAGILIGIRIFRYLEEFIVLYGHHKHLSEVFRETAVSSMVAGSLVVFGISILLILPLDMFLHANRIQRESEALRKKNLAMEELNRQTQRLAHHQRLEIMGTLTSSIAHEFNNLLTPIMGNSMMALERLVSDEEELYDELLEIYSASCKAKEIISRLSDLSRKNTETCFRQASPDELIRKMVRTAEPARADNVQIVMNLNCWDQRLTANEIQLSQMILNLILNGFHAMEPDGGVLTLSTNFDESHIHIQVTDTGCGIPKDIHSKIFEPFFTTKEAGKGTGLGLAIVAQVVEDHHGKIRVESQEGSGTTFTVSLPRLHIAEEEPDI
jgi:signal transduction histidine kinase